jgi:hypothetical protein
MNVTRPELLNKWKEVLEHPNLPAISDQYRKEVTAVLLENQERALMEEKVALFESPVNVGGGSVAGIQNNGTTGGPIAGYDPILISLVRRAMPQMIAYDICGVQPMTQPTGLIFAMKARYENQGGAEAFYNEANTEFAGKPYVADPDGAGPLTAEQNLFDGGAGAGFTGDGADVQSTTNPGAAGVTTGVGASTTQAEAGWVGGNTFPEMAFSIERTSVVAQARALKAEYSIELAQDLKAVHGLDAEAELSNILSTEILSEINREVVRRVYIAAKVGGQQGDLASAGTFNLEVDSRGRWNAEKFKDLLFQIEREANTIATQTRRGKGNFILCSQDVASALAMAGVLDYTPAINTSGVNVDVSSTSFAGVLNGRYKVYVDPYLGSPASTGNFFVVGYKGASAFDAGIFYCPYVPLQMVRAVDPNNFQPKIAFKTRYGIVDNPFSVGGDAIANGAGLKANSNVYYRKMQVSNLMNIL